MFQLTIFLAYNCVWVFMVIELLEQSQVGELCVIYSKNQNAPYFVKRNRYNFDLILFFSSFSLYCHKKAFNSLQLNWNHVNWEWSNINYLENHSSSSHLFHFSTHRCNLPLQVDQLQSSSHVWNHIWKNRRGEKRKENRVEPTQWTPRKPKSISLSVSNVSFSSCQRNLIKTLF